MRSRWIYAGFALALSFAGCMKDDLPWDPDHSLPHGSGPGIFVVNEGNFMYGNASLTWYDPDTREVREDVFYTTNGVPLGDVAHSMTIRDSLGYVVVNNSGRIYIFDTGTFEVKGKITGLTSPRYMHFVSDTKAYVSDLYARAIAIVDPESRQITGSIPLSNGNPDFYQHASEQMLQYDRFVFTNCWSYDNQILVIDTGLDRVIDSVEVLKQPNSMVLDRSHSLWVLCDGGTDGSPYGHEAGGLLEISAGATEARIVWRFSPEEHPTDLRINSTGDTLYFINGDIYRFAIHGMEDPELFIESPYQVNAWMGYYGLDVDPVSSELYVADAMDFVQPGRIYRFTPQGEPLDTFRSGIAPGAFCFNF